jgi:trehalose 6-phosphate phosphatase
MIDPPAITGRTALLLDVDGTLIDFAPTPDSVIVPPGLPEALAALRDRLGGALAVITGRPIDQIDRLFPGIPHAVAGEHGAAIRHHPGGPIERGEHPPVPADWLEAAEAAIGQHPGALLERKAHGVTLHFRQAPQAGPYLRTLADSLLARLPTHALLTGSMVWEIRPRGIDKGRALLSLMARPPFLGRTPMFIGDDVTDEDAITAARAMGGTGLKVADAFGTPNGVRAWLEQQARVLF